MKKFKFMMGFVVLLAVGFVMGTHSGDLTQEPNCNYAVANLWMYAGALLMVVGIGGFIASIFIKDK